MDAFSRESAVAQPTIQQLFDQHLEEIKGTFAKAHSEIKEKNNALISQLKIIEAHEKRIVVLIDGDGAIFLPSLIAEGKQGGYSAASRLTTGIKSYLGPQQFKLLVYVFHNKRGLTATLKHHGYDGAADKFEDFITGFNEAAERFVMVDAGELEEGIDQKLRAYLDDEICLTQTTKVFFGGCHKKGYITALNSCIASGHEEKLVLLPGNNHIAVEMKNLGLPSLKIPALFLAVNLSQPPVLHTTNRSRIPTPPTSPRSIDTKSTASSIGTSVGSPHVENSDPAIAGENSHALRKTDPKHPLQKQDPPPCKWHYLAKCKRPADCQWGHDYDLREDEVETLRNDVKKNPCNAVAKGEECPRGSSCIFGHVCPYAPRCRYNVEGKCKFSGEVTGYFPS